MTATTSSSPEPVASSSSPLAERRVSGRDWIGFMAMVVGMFMAILDIQIVSSSLAEIQAGISASADEIAWVQTAYLIAEVVIIPLTGWLSRVMSTRWLFVASCVTFTVMSAGCAFAWSIDSMIVFRVLQGFLGGAMIPTVFATSFTLFPREKQAQTSVIIGLTATMAPTLGPTLGGWLTQTLNWHWLFLINVVPGIIVTTLVVLFVRVNKPNWSLLRTLDVPGILMVALFLGSLQYLLEEGPLNNWFEEPKIRYAAVASVCGLVLMLARELTAKHPVIDLHAFRNGNFVIGSLYSFVIGIGLYGSVYVLPLYLGRIRHYDSLEIGLIMMVTGAFQFISAPLAGALSKKIDLRLMLGIGLALFGGGLYLNHDLTTEWGFGDLFLPQAVRGLSLMLLFIPVNQIALGRLPKDEIANASGLYNLMRNLGGAIGLAVINTVLIDRSAHHGLWLAEKITAARPVVIEQLAGVQAHLFSALGEAAVPASLALIGQRLRIQAQLLAVSDVWLLMALVFGASLLLMPFVRAVGHGGEDSGGH